MRREKVMMDESRRKSGIDDLAIGIIWNILMYSEKRWTNECVATVPG
jgi:hypothetical protein